MNYLETNLQFLNTKNKTKIKSFERINNGRKLQLTNAKNGQLNLEINGNSYYSKYNPNKDVEQFILAQINSNAHHFIICGLGLGYHAETLVRLEPKKITIFEQDISLLHYLFTNVDFSHLLKNSNINLVTHLKDLTITKNDNLIIPTGWLNSLEDGNLKYKFQEFQVNVLGIKNNRQRLLDNFHENLKFSQHNIKPLLSYFKNKKAILVSAGPSLDEVVQHLEKFKGRYFILCVGAAYTTLEYHNITPDAVIITDPHSAVLKQIKKRNLIVPLFFLSTVYPSIPQYIHSLKIILFQHGFSLAEEIANESSIPLIQTGGSVATTAFDLLIQLGFKEIILLGQDLAYGKNKSHASTSTSNKEFSEIVVNRTTISNTGKIIPTTTSWMIFKQFFEKKIREDSTLRVYNTAIEGANIEGTVLLNLDDIKLESVEKINFVKLLEERYEQHVFNGE